ncbi:LytR/AlgR family response regulator transcription factor [Butyrivibrio proteoclasticus]|uniref:LytR/AlgR family response regulator transcription factor n=1 Tax=Butyrivibrio proteoclasticus TaxID=43305 RepID=UPI00047A3F93|nr:response regulator [Butyrivibrio proteoclasticus]
MHIAVCDDNIADRKQTERLLGRQSDRFFKETGERLHIDSYGNVSAFMSFPQMYDGLFVDMVQSEKDGIEITKMLLDVGVVRPIILCSSSIDYRTRWAQEGTDATNIYFLDKPIKVAELTATMDMIKELKGEETPSLELRNKDKTIYAKDDDIVCVRKKGAELHIYLKDGQVVTLMDEIYNFYDQCRIFPQICPLTDNSLININHIQKRSFGKVQMDNGMIFNIAFSYRNSIKEAQAILDSQK